MTSQLSLEFPIPDVSAVLRDAWVDSGRRRYLRGYVLETGTDWTVDPSPIGAAALVSSMRARGCPRDVALAYLAEADSQKTRGDRDGVLIMPFLRVRAA